MDVEKECSLLGSLFHNIVTDLKSSSPVWEDFVTKGTKLHNLLKSTSVAFSAFVESIQKVADIATNTKGSTKDIGSALTRICVRQKMVENKFKSFTSSLMDNLLCPVQERLEEWKKSANQLEKDHAKEYKRAMHEIKKRNNDTLRLQKKARKGSKTDLHNQLNSVMLDVTDRYNQLQDTEKSALRNLLVEERSRMCLFANCLSPVLDLQVALLNEVSHLQELSADVAKLCRNPKQLPTSTEQLVQDFISANSQQVSTLQDTQSNGFLHQSSIFSSPPSSPASNGSRKSSVCSLNSLTSSDSRSTGSLSRHSTFHHHYQGLRRANSNSTNTNGQSSPTSCKSAPGLVPVARLSSVSSHDSGFVSTGNGTVPLTLLPPHHYDVSSKPPLPDRSQKVEVMNDDVSPTNFPCPSPCEQNSNMNSPPSVQSKTFSWMDWSRPGPYDLINAHRKDQDSGLSNPPNKSVPPPLSPKPSYLIHHSSVNEASSFLPPPPLNHMLSEPQFFPYNPPKDNHLHPAPLTEQVDEDDDPLPPPPPSLLEDTEMPSSTAVDLPLHPTPQITPIPHYVPNNDFQAMTLGRKNSSHSSHCSSSSSGYSSQKTTPACSADTIASHDTDNGLAENEEQSNGHKSHYDYEKFSTLPRNYYHRKNDMLRCHGSYHKRPSSMVGIPPAYSVDNDTQATATIRRKPSSKFNSVRRTPGGPKAVKPPTVPSAVANLMSTFMPPT